MLFGQLLLTTSVSSSASGVIRTFWLYPRKSKFFGTAKFMLLKRPPPSRLGFTPPPTPPAVVVRRATIVGAREVRVREAICFNSPFSFSISWFFFLSS